MLTPRGLGFAPRRGSAGQNLPYTTQNFNNLGGYDVAALTSALQACGLQVGCAPGGAPSPAAVAAMQQNIPQPQRCRRTMMGLGKFAVAGNAASATGGTNPIQYPFRGIRLVVPTEISPSGDLVDLQVGTEHQIVQSQAVAPATNPGIPLRAFDQTAQDSGFIDMDWCPPTGSTSILVSVSNKFAGQYTFEGSLEGLQLL